MALLRSTPPPTRRWESRAPRLLVVSGSVGAGHDGAASELADRVRAAGVDVDVRDLLDVLPGPVPRVLRDGYRLSVDRVPVVFDRLFSALEHGGVARTALLEVCRAGRAGVSGWLAEHAYDAVVSTYPLASQCLGELRRRGHAPLPLLTYLTDPAVHRSWVHPLVDAHLTVTRATARQGARDYGLPMTVAGPLVPRRFAAPEDPRRSQQLRRELGLPPGRPVALIVAGSLGLGAVVPTATEVAGAGLVPVVLCGRNGALRARVAAVPGAVALGWRDDVHALMAVADVLVQNAGGLSFTEALVAGLPAVSYRCIPGHGQANAEVLRDAGLAPWPRDPQELRAALHAQVGTRQPPAPHEDPSDLVLDVLLGDRSRAASA